jgi:hypothetical protein
VLVRRLTVNDYLCFLIASDLKLLTQKNLHFSANEIIMIENNQYYPVLSMLIPNFKRKELKLRNLEIKLSYSDIIDEGLRSLELSLNETKCPEPKAEEFVRTLYVFQALDLTQKLLEHVSNTDRIAATNTSLTTLQTFELAHTTLLNLVYSQHDSLQLKDVSISSLQYGKSGFLLLN